MIKRYRRRVAALLIPLVLIWSMMLPFQVQAFIPALIAGASAFIKTPLGKSFAVSAGIHAAALSIQFYDQLNSETLPTDESKLRLEVKLNPKDPMKVPAGWSAGAAGAVEPVAPATAGSAVSSTQWRYLTSYPWMNTKKEAGTYACNNAASPKAYYDEPDNRCCDSIGVACGGQIGGFYTQTVSTCPSGYTNVSGTCTKSDETVVVKPSDNMTEVKRVQNVFYTDARDSLDGLPPNTTVTASDVNFKDSFGNSWNLHINADGTMTSTETRPRVDGSGQTDVTKVGFSAPDGSTGAVEVTGLSKQTFAGTGSQMSATPNAPGTEPVKFPSEPVKFPSDYSKAGEAATAAQSINDALGPKLDKITESGADPTDPTQPQGSQFDQAYFQGTFTNLLGWQLPAHTSQCPTSSFNWNNNSYTINSHCQLVNDHFSALSSVMAVVWTILALFILLGA